jgi:hypothetical protein
MKVIRVLRNTSDYEKTHFAFYGNQGLKVPIIMLFMYFVYNRCELLDYIDSKLTVNRSDTMVEFEIYISNLR